MTLRMRFHDKARVAVALVPAETNKLWAAQASKRELSEGADRFGGCSLSSVAPWAVLNTLSSYGTQTLIFLFRTNTK